MKTLSVKLTGSLRKADIVDQLIVMEKIGAARDEKEEEYDDSFCTEIIHITDEVKAVLEKRLAFDSITSWKKDLKGVLREFRFMNLLVYLVCSRDKSFDMQALKTFKYFYDGFVKNVRVSEPGTGHFPLQLRIIYFRAYVHYSFTCNEPLTVFVAMGHLRSKVQLCFWVSALLCVLVTCMRMNSWIIQCFAAISWALILSYP